MVDNRAGLRMSSIMEEPVPMRAMRSMPSLGEGEVGSEGHRTNGWDREREDGRDELPSSSRVTINPLHPPWDDNSLPDQPYENPYYTLPIKDALWLPTNPIGTLDLDMTVTMNVALTSEPGAGNLGPPSKKLIRVGSVLSGLTADLESVISLSGDEMSISGLPLDGTEEIELTPAIASRVQNLKGNGDVPATDQQSELPLVAPSLLTGSLGSMSNGPLPRTVGAASGRTYPRYTPMDEAGRLAVGRPTQSSPPRRLSLNRVHSTNSQNSFLPLPSSGGGSRFAQRSTTIHASAQSVSIREVLNEETGVLQRSRVVLQEEAGKQNTPRSWWTSWAFRNRE